MLSSALGALLPCSTLASALRLASCFVFGAIPAADILWEQGGDWEYHHHGQQASLLRPDETHTQGLPELELLEDDEQRLQAI